MQYLGSKNRIAKELAPIIQSFITADTKGYLEPFVGGANMIDKIDFPVRVGYDIHPNLIALLKQTQDDISVFPSTISEDEYYAVKENKSKYDSWYVGLVGFCAGFGSNYFGGFARSGDGRIDKTKEAINNLKRQSVKLKGIDFAVKSFLDIDPSEFTGWVVYCDPPYSGSRKYSTGKFDYDKFYEWCISMSKRNIVLISEYDMPSDFNCIWSKEHSVNFSSTRTFKSTRVEKLFAHKSICVESGLRGIMEF